LEKAGHKLKGPRLDQLTSGWSGPLKSAAADRVDRLGEIIVPTLITYGRHDLATPPCAETLRQGIPNSEMQIFEESAHMAHLEEPDRYLQTVKQFLNRVEEGSTG
jgi:proline iminopeptidase